MAARPLGMAPRGRECGKAGITCAECGLFSDEGPEPGDLFGQKAIAYFTGERDVWSARVNQAMARPRKLVRDPIEQEGLRLMRDFHGRTNELAQFLDGTHPALFAFGLGVAFGFGVLWGIFLWKILGIGEERRAELLVIGPVRIEDQ